MSFEPYSLPSTDGDPINNARRILRGKKYPEKKKIFTGKMILATWEYVEEKVYRKFEITLKLTVNDVLFVIKDTVNTLQ